MTSNFDKSLVLAINNQSVTTSLVIAKAFERRHKDVLRAIRNIAKPWGKSTLPPCIKNEINEFSRLNFEKTFYKDERNKMQPMYLITQDGFAMLAMGFTGTEALILKIRFLNAFNQISEGIFYEQ